MDSSAELLSVEVLPAEDGVVLVRVGGELDVHTAPTFSAGLEPAFESGAAIIEIDAARLQFCDSSGIQVLVQARQRALDAGGSVRMINLQGPVAKVLTVTGLLELFS